MELLYGINSVFLVSVRGVNSVFLRLTVFEELNGNRSEERVGKNVFVLLYIRFYLFAELIEFRFEKVCGALGYLFFVADYLFYEFGLYGNGSSAVFPSYEPLEFL